MNIKEGNTTKEEKEDLPGEADSMINSYDFRSQGIFRGPESIEGPLEEEADMLASSYKMISVVGRNYENRLVTKVHIGAIAHEALFDSGAQFNMVPKELLEKAKIKYQDTSDLVVRGFGTDGFVRAMGKVTLALRMHGLTLAPCEFIVLRGEHLGGLIILGVNVIGVNKLILDPRGRRVTRKFGDGSIWDCFMGDGTEDCRILWSRLPCYASCYAKIQPGHTQSVTVSWSYPGEFEGGCCVARDGSQELMFIDEREDLRSLQLVSGLIPSSASQVQVLVVNGGNRGEKIRNRQLIGTVSSVVDVEELQATEKVAVVTVEHRNIQGYSGLGADVEAVVLGDHLSDKEKTIVGQLLRHRRGVFGSTNEVGKLDVADHKIELTDYNPIYQRPRRFPEKVNEEIETQCRELELLDVIEQSQSGWSSPVVPIRKRDGTIRLCVDYRRLNAVTKPDKFPIPNLSDAVFGLYGVKFFTTLDLIKGYYQVPLEESSRQYTAFSTPRQHWQFKRLSFGLKNAPSAFQRTMQSVLSEFSWRKVIVYIDDVLIMGDTFTEHLDLCKRVLSTLESYGVKLNLGKCKWFCQEVEFLGHVVSSSGLRKPEEYIKTILDFPQPKTKSQLRGFLGLLNFQRKYVPNCSIIMRPLSQATGGKNKNGSISWTEDMDSAFRHLKDAMAKDITLAFPDYGEDAEPLSLYTDASGLGIGACLTQVQGESVRVIAYASVSFNRAEMKYSTMERELAAIRWAVKNFRQFLFGIEFVINTDHRPLLYLYNLQIVNMRLARTLRDLSEYNFVIRFTPGRENVAADALSRMDHPLSGAPEGEQSEENLPCGIIRMEKVAGGGDALVESLYVAGYAPLGNKLPDSVLKLREKLVDELLRDPDEYRLLAGKSRTRELRLMSQPGQLMCPEVISAFAHIFQCVVFVHVGKDMPIAYTPPNFEGEHSPPRVHLHCLAGVHYNPLGETRLYQPPRLPTRGPLVAVNRFPRESDTVELGYGVCSEDVSGDSEENHIDVSVNENWCSQHKRSHSASIVTVFEGVSSCVLLDSGAQVSCVSESVFRRTNAVLREAGGLEIVGIGCGRSPVLGVVTLNLKLALLELQHNFVVVSDECMNFCFVFGIELMAAHGLKIDMGNLMVSVGCKVMRFPKVELCVPALLEAVSCPISLASVSVGNMFDRSPASMVDIDELLELQKSYPIGLLRRTVESFEEKWPPTLRKFHRYRKSLHSQDSLLLFSNGEKLVPVVPFKFMVDVVLVLHYKQGHPGRQKLIAAVSDQVWHPSLSAVAADVSRACNQCQRVKIAGVAQPPVVKIRTSSPFELLSVDLTALPRTSRGNNCCLVTVDHNSKWMCAVPLPNKTAAAVTRAMRNRVFPSLPTLPQRLLSDNGVEFKSREFNSLLDSLSVQHVYTSAYKPSSNGLVERANRTIGELLRSVGAKVQDWDEHIPAVVILYNSSHHSELKESPSSYLLTKSHDLSPRAPLPQAEKEYWREGNPSFKPFKPGQLVLLKKVFKGRCVNDKLADRYLGPFVVTLKNENNVTYVIQRCSDGYEQRAHYTQLRKYYKPPPYLANHPSYNRVADGKHEIEDNTDCEHMTSGTGVLEEENDVPVARFVGASRWRDSSSQSSELNLRSAGICGKGEKLDMKNKEVTGDSSVQGARRGPVIDPEVSCRITDYYDSICEVEQSYVNGSFKLSRDRDMNFTIDDFSSVSQGMTWSLFRNDPEFWSLCDLSSGGSVGSSCTLSTFLEPEDQCLDTCQISTEGDPELRSRIHVCDSFNFGRMFGQVGRMKDATRKTLSYDDIREIDTAKWRRKKQMLWLSKDLIALDLNTSGASFVSVSKTALDRFRLLMESKRRLEGEHKEVIGSEDEVSSVLKSKTVPLAGRITRSQGAVQNHPRVQPRTLEYRQRSSGRTHVLAPSGEECRDPIL